MDIKKAVSDDWKQAGKVIFWIAVIAGGIWMANIFFTQLQQNSEKELDSKLDTVCGVIKNEQPNNLTLYDKCWNTGHEQFAKPADDREQNN